MSNLQIDPLALSPSGELGPKHNGQLTSTAGDHLQALTMDDSWTGTQLTRAPAVLAPSPRMVALGLSLSPLASGSSTLRPPSSPSTPGLPPITPGTPRTPGSPLSGAAELAGGGCSCPSPHARNASRALSISLARRASVASLLSEDGIDVSKLDLRPVCTPPPGTVPLPPLPGHAHPFPSPGLGGFGGASPGSVAAMLPINHQHGRRTSASSIGNGHGHTRSPSQSHSQLQGHAVSCSHSHTPSRSASVCPSSAGSLHPSPLLGPLLAPALPIVPPGPTLAETGLRISPDISHASGQLERKSPRPRLVRLDSFGGEGLEQKPSGRRGTGDSEIGEIEIRDEIREGDVV